jgi:hypothetical protein
VVVALGYLVANRLLHSKRGTQRNIELIWLSGRLMPDFKTIANFRKDNGKAIRRRLGRYRRLRLRALQPPPSTRRRTPSQCCRS